LALGITISLAEERRVPVDIGDRLDDPPETLWTGCSHDGMLVGTEQERATQ
jgi:hypothetical protein